jgi:hypothetical protein
MKGKDLLFSAFNATLRLKAELAGAKDEANPARRAAVRAAIFTIFVVVEFEN